ncbi:hypothetical protein LX64_01644 [Chitinophaga skermanii]|uniref:Uncharacterized protein n=1 Tax=Chitinophaga skermanii TaxID=331697 RepID=A0A327QXZ2_9BACT|nr:hypothetical protein [Chitinophaga skermanii]RAJ06517.1 hypothetical protein LX64_01644 [Chitinophaga skermanii]
MSDLKFISKAKNTGFPEYLDFDTLRLQGIQHIAALSGKIWTDHNFHDPGMTMLDALCYVLTDLDYRTKFDFKDLVAKANNEQPEDNFYTAAQILGNNPLTEIDIRKMLIDIKGVRNAWIEKTKPSDYSLTFACATGKLQYAPLTVNSKQVPLKGLYRVLIEPDDTSAAAYELDACGNSVFPLSEVVKEVEERLYAHRNLCEDIFDVVVLDKTQVGLCMHIELAANYDPEAVQLAIYTAIQEFLSPSPKFYSLSQMLDKKVRMEEIFEGRPYNFDQDKALQQNGFIDTNELLSIERQTVLYASDLYRIIMDVPGVAGITRLMMSKYNDGEYNNGEEPGGEEWQLPLDPYRRPVFSPERSNTIFYRNKLPFTANTAKVNQQFAKRLSDYNKLPKKDEGLDTMVPTGRYMDLATYKSIQYEFPAVYAIGKNDVSKNDTAIRKAQALQLQAYLLFFDRILADYFAQLAKIRPLFSMQTGGEPATYFPANIDAVPGLSNLLRYEKQLPVTTTGEPFKGMKLAHEPHEKNVTGPKTYTTLYSRDEAMKRIMNACAENNVVSNVAYIESADYWMVELLDLSENVLLEATVYFYTKEDAQQAARDLIFLAGIPANYYLVNEREAESFSFDLVYIDANYNSLLNTLYESKEQYQVRKEKLLNHLLARFSEDFTDYALMMYNLNGKQNDPARNIEDKANFLSNYAQTSANRSLAINYRNKYTTIPSSGLENRVKGLMGIRPAPTGSLNNFDLVTTIQQTQFSLVLTYAGIELFKSESLHDQAKDAYLQFLQYAKNVANYKTFGCTSEDVFGFIVQSPVGAEEYISVPCTVTFTSAEERDEMMEWCVKFFNEDGKPSYYLQTSTGFYFQFLDNDNTVLLRSKKGFDTAEASLQHAYDLIDFMQNEVVWKTVKAPNVDIYNVVVVDGITQLAIHPKAFHQKAAADEAKQWLYNYFRQHNLRYIESSEALTNWQSAYNDTQWKGFRPFKQQEQLPAAFLQFVMAAADIDQYHQTITSEGKVELSVIGAGDGEENVPVVLSVQAQLYETTEAAQAAIFEAKQVYHETYHTLKGMVHPVQAVYAYIVADEAPAGFPSPLMKTTKAIPKGQGLGAFLHKLLHLATDPARLLVAPLDECYFVVRLRNHHQEVLAESEPLTSKEDADALLMFILNAANNENLRTELSPSIEMQGLLWKHADTQVPLMQGLSVWEEANEAMTAFVSNAMLLTHLQIVPHDEQNGKFGFKVINTKNIYFAKQANYYDTPQERDAAVAQLQLQLDSLCNRQATSIIDSSNYYFAIQDGSDVLLTEPHPYASLFGAEEGFYKAIRFGKTYAYYVKTVVDNCTFGFYLVDDEEAITAFHPHTYLTEEERDEAIERIINFLKDHGASIITTQMPGYWKPVTKWLTCHLQPGDALEGINENASQEEAEQVLIGILELAKTAGNYNIVLEDQLYKIYLEEAGTRVAFHGQTFCCKSFADKAIARLVEFAKYKILDTDPVLLNTAKNVQTVPFIDNDNIPDEEKLVGYRLWDRDQRLARFNQSFLDKATTEQAALDLLHKYQRVQPTYTVMDRGEGAVAYIKGEYYFVISRNEENLWQSLQGYASVENALKAFEEVRYQVLEQSLKVANYQPWTSTDTALVLLDECGEPLVQCCAEFESHTDYMVAVRARQLFALRHGVYMIDGRFSFHLYNTQTNRYDWEAVQTYATEEQAWKALSECLQLLRYRGSYCIERDPEANRCIIQIAHILLDIQYVTKECVKKEEEEEDKNDQEKINVEDAAWERLQVFLDSERGLDTQFFRYTDYTHCCKYGFRMVDVKTYRVAQLSSWYQSMQKRENERLNLMADVLCMKRVYGWFLRDAVHNPAIDEALLACYFKQPLNLHFNKLWLRYNGLPAMEDGIWTLNSEVLQGTTITQFFYEMKVGGQVIWQSVNRYLTKEDAQRNESQYFIYLLEIARSITSYSVETVIGCENAFTIALRDIDGAIIATSPGHVCKEDVDKEVNTRIFNALMFPIVEQDGEFAFEVNEIIQIVAGDKVTYSAQQVWESVITYDTPQLAMDALIQSLKLFRVLDNYQRNDEDVAGPYSVTLVDPAGVMALHPLVYTRLSDRDAAIDLVQRAISSEGMRLVEHILLRPRQQAVVYETLEVEMLWFPNGKQNSQQKLLIKGETSFNGNLQAFIQALKLATATTGGVTMKDNGPNQELNWWNNGMKIAAAEMPGKNMNEWNAEVQMVLKDAFAEQASFESANTGLSRVVTEGFSVSNALFPVCSEADFCSYVDPNAPKYVDEKFTDRTFLVDPYSFWATVVLPAWPQRFRKTRFRQFFEDTLRKEAPAHIRLHIVWVSPQQMLQFETAYKNWLQALANDMGCDFVSSQQALVETISNLKNVFPAEYLDDAGDMNDQSLLLLDEAMLG